MTRGLFGRWSIEASAGWYPARIRHEDRPSIDARPRRCAIRVAPKKDMRPQGPHVQFENAEADFGMARWW
jgi:hypothetical protein